MDEHSNSQFLGRHSRVTGQIEKAHEDAATLLGWVLEVEGKVRAAENAKDRLVVLHQRQRDRVLLLPQKAFENVNWTRIESHTLSSVNS